MAQIPVKFTYLEFPFRNEWTAKVTHTSSMGIIRDFPSAGSFPTKDEARQSAIDAFRAQHSIETSDEGEIEV
jgi:hypothetical protein